MTAQKTDSRRAAVLAYQKRSSARLFSAVITHNGGNWRNAALMPGCALAAYSPSLIKSVYGHLGSHMPGIGIVLECCAKPGLHTGNRADFTPFYAKLEEQLKLHRLDTVITACANCYMTLKRFSPGLTVRSLYEVLLKTGIPERDYSAMPPAALHDPCPTRRESVLHGSVRGLLELMKYPFEEFPLNRGQTVCCGCGGMLALKDPARALAQMRKRCAQTGSGIIISYCQSCAEAMTRGGKRGWHLLDLIFNESLSPGFVQPRQGTLRRWVNRYRSKRMVSKLSASSAGENRE